VWLLPELDGVRIISNSLCEFLHRVPDATVEIFKIGSCTAGAMLVDALELLERNDGRAHDTIRAIRESDGLAVAVETCLNAAAHEYHAPLQQLLLKAAAYGASFMHLRSPLLMEKTIRQLRALNAVRAPQVGLPMTKPQLVRLTPAALTLRLAHRNLHYLALQVFRAAKQRGVAAAVDGLHKLVDVPSDEAARPVPDVALRGGRRRRGRQRARDARSRARARDGCAPLARRSDGRRREGRERSRHGGSNLLACLLACVARKVFFCLTGPYLDRT
jgi:hypothetical protein